jgi:hypothetical protein
MTQSNAKKFKIKHGVDSNFLQNVLTKDITSLESIFELVDNAVDAAREQLLKSGQKLELDNSGLPKHYDGFKIEIRVRSNSLVFADNCAGISKEVLIDRAFMIGAMSNHAFGIGRFGIGLKRALFKLGTKYRIYTDTGDFRAAMSFQEKHLIGSDPTLAHQRPSLGRHMTIVRIGELRDRVRHEFSAASWLEHLADVLSKRYGRYVQKGFQIILNQKSVPPFGPSVRSLGPVKPNTAVIDAGHDVTIFVESGMHEDYRLSDEVGYSKSTIGKLTNEFGWYFVCNDRIVEIATHTPPLGWTTKWHQEYYGFVGWVHFVAEDPQDLPWDTKKTTIDPHSLAFRAVVDKLQSFAEAYKIQNKRARNKDSADAGERAAWASNDIRGAKPQSQPQQTTANIGTRKPKNSQPSSSTTAQSTSSGPTSNNTHNQQWQSLLPDLGITVKSPKVSSLLVEAFHLPLELCYSGSMLFRSIVEIALFEHLKMTKSLRKVKEMVYEENAKKGRDFSDDKKTKFRPDFRTALDWLGRNDSYFPEELRRDCVYARNKFGKHLQEMNGITRRSDKSIQTSDDSR